jgi:hypothetical protein
MENKFNNFITMRKNKILIGMQVREFFSKRILPTFEKMIADKSSKICILSLILTTLSIIPHWGYIAYVCIALDAFCLNDARK